MEKVDLKNIRSVKFALDSFVVPVLKPRTKNTIYTERAQNISAAKNKQAPLVKKTTNTANHNPSL